jgi:cell division protein FtsN
MPTMVTFQPGKLALIAVLLTLAAACSREQQDWRSAEAADTTEAWGRFLEQHPDGELAAQARQQIRQLTEARDWQHADSVGTVEAYRGFLAQHPTGKWADEARIRIEAFALGSAPRTPPQTPEEAERSKAPAGVNALQVATGVAPAAAELAQTPAAEAGMATPGEAAQAAPSADVALVRDALPDDGYGVQLGAFGSPASADREWQRLQGRFSAQLGGLSPRIVVASTDSGRLYRLQAPAAGEAQARAICDSLREQAQACVPVMPR